MFRCRHKRLQEKWVPTDRKSSFPSLIICENKLSKAKLYKSKFVKKITECNYLFTFQNSPYFLVNIFVIPVPFHYFTFSFKFYFPNADIIVNHLCILFLRSRKTSTKFYKKNRKKSVARNIVESKKISFSDLCLTRFSRSGKLHSNVKSWYQISRNPWLWRMK